MFTQPYFYLICIFFTITVVTLLTTPVLWYKLSETRILRARTTIIDFVFWILACFSAAGYFSQSYDEATNDAQGLSCAAIIWFNYVVNFFDTRKLKINQYQQFTLCIVIKFYRLFFLFHATKQQLRDQMDIEESGKETVECSKFFCRH